MMDGSVQCWPGRLLPAVCCALRSPPPAPGPAAIEHRSAPTAERYIAPTTAFNLGEKLDDPVAMYLNDIYTISANLAGICGISVPVGNDKLGLPVGVQLMGAAFSEQTILDVALALEKEVNFDVCPPAMR